MPIITESLFPAVSHSIPFFHLPLAPNHPQRKRQRVAAKKTATAKAKTEAAEYHRIFQQRLNERKESRRSAVSKRRSSRRASGKAE